MNDLYDVISIVNSSQSANHLVALSLTDEVTPVCTVLVIPLPSLSSEKLQTILTTRGARLVGFPREPVCERSYRLLRGHPLPVSLVEDISSSQPYRDVPTVTGDIDGHLFKEVVLRLRVDL